MFWVLHQASLVKHQKEFGGGLQWMKNSCKSAKKLRTALQYLQFSCICEKVLYMSSVPGWMFMGFVTAYRAMAWCHHKGGCKERLLCPLLVTGMPCVHGEHLSKWGSTEQHLHQCHPLVAMRTPFFLPGAPYHPAPFTFPLLSSRQYFKTVQDFQLS